MTNGSHTMATQKSSDLRSHVRKEKNHIGFENWRRGLKFVKSASTAIRMAAHCYRR